MYDVDAASWLQALRGMAHLTERKRRALILYKVFGYTLEDIADALEVCKSTVHRDVSSSLETINRIRTKTEDEGGI